MQDLDDILAEMWEEAWSPETGNIHLFATDFGAILACELASSFHGRLLFRSRKDLTHCSVWWADSRVEAFAFHKALKALYDRQERALVAFYDGIESLVGG